MMWVSGQRGCGSGGGRRCGDPHSCLVPQFCGTIVLIFFLELAVAVLAFLFQDWVRDRFREFFESNIRSYRDDIDLQNLIDSLQKAVSTRGGPDRGPALLVRSVCCSGARLVGAWGVESLEGPPLPLGPLALLPRAAWWSRLALPVPSFDLD